MLTKRTHILLSKDQWKKASQIARSRSISFGELMRNFVDTIVKQDQRLHDIRTALANIRRVRTFSKKRIDYKKLINYGRRY